MAKVQYMGTGRRKKSVARVRLVPGNGNVVINKREIENFFGLETLRMIVNQPLVLTGTKDKFDVLVNVHGGGFTGQAGSSGCCCRVPRPCRPSSRCRSPAARSPRAGRGCTHSRPRRRRRAPARRARPREV